MTHRQKRTTNVNLFFSRVIFFTNLKPNPFLCCDAAIFRSVLDPTDIASGPSDPKPNEESAPKRSDGQIRVGFFFKVVTAPTSTTAPAVRIVKHTTARVTPLVDLPIESPPFQFTPPAPIFPLTRPTPPQPFLPSRSVAPPPPQYYSQAVGISQQEQQLRMEQQRRAQQEQLRVQLQAQQARALQAEQQRLAYIENQQRLEQQQRYAAEQQRAQQMAEQQQLIRQRKIREYLDYQKSLGVPDTLYVTVGDTEITVHRLQNEPNIFAVDINNPSKGFGDLVSTDEDGPKPGRRNGFKFKWIGVDRTDSKIASNMTDRNNVFTKPHYLRETVAAKQQQQQSSRYAPSFSPPEKQLPQVTIISEDLELEDYPLKPQTLELAVRSDVATAAERTELLKEQEQQLARIVAKPKATLRREQEAIEQEAYLENERLDHLRRQRDIEDRKLKIIKREALTEELAKIKTKRIQELEEESEHVLEEYRAREAEQEKKVKRLKAQVKEADPDTRVEQADQQLQIVRERRLLSEIREAQLEVLRMLQETINRRLFSERSSRDRTLVEMLALLPNERIPLFTDKKAGRGNGGRTNDSFQDFARKELERNPLTRNGVPVDMVEYQISPAGQKQVLSLLLCGTEIVPGYVQSVIGLKKGDCTVMK